MVKIFSVGIINFLNKFVIFWAIFIFFNLIGYFLKNILRKKLRLNLLQKEIITFLSDLVFYIFLILGLIFGLTTIGINTNTLIASLGLGGFAIGLALKDIVANFVSGVMIVLGKTFRVGDTLKISNFEGKVKAINLRHTILIDSQNPKQQILIPNNNIFSSIITIKKENQKS